MPKQSTVENYFIKFLLQSQHKPLHQQAHDDDFANQIHSEQQRYEVDD